MSSEPSLVYQCAAELLADGEWHNYSEIVRKASKVVPPGVAMRKIETIRLASARKHKGYSNPSQRKIMRSDTRLIEYGALAVARQVLSGSVLFEIEPRGTKQADGPKRIRLAPGKEVWRPQGG